jgi:hypothetical protein
MFAGQPHGKKHHSRGRYGRLPDAVGGGGLYYVRRSVAYCAVGVCEPICMKVRLLNAGAYKKQDGAHNDKQKMSAAVV